MGNALAKMLIATVFGLLDQLLTPENFKLLADKVLDTVEDTITDSHNTIDDKLLPYIQRFRTTFDIPDNDEPEAVEPAAPATDPAQPPQP